MKPLYVRRFFVQSALALALPLACANVHAQEAPGRAAPGMVQGAEQGPQPGLQGLRQLDLSPEQRKQLRLLSGAQEDATRPLIRQIEEEHISLRELENSDQYDSKKAVEIAERIGNLQTKLVLNMAEAHHKMLSILTPQQRVKLKESGAVIMHP